VVAVLEQLFRLREGYLVREKSPSRNVGFFDFGFLGFDVAYEVKRDKTVVKSHAFRYFDFIIDSTTFLDKNNAFLADVLHSLSSEVPNVGIASGDGGLPQRRL